MTSPHDYSFPALAAEKEKGRSAVRNYPAMVRRAEIGMEVSMVER